MTFEAREFQQALLNMDHLRTRKVLGEVLAREGRMHAVEKLVVPAMEAIGQEWDQGRIALAQVYMSGRVCEKAVEAVLGLEDDLSDASPQIGLAVFMDQHQLGKRIVGSVLKVAGFRVKDYGAGLDADTLARMALSDRVPVLMVSVLMLASAMHLKDLRKALGNGPERPTLVAGGAPFRFDPLLGADVGVDAVGLSAADAVKLARHFLGEPCLG